MRDLWTSISAITEAYGKDGTEGCIRRWFFLKPMKLPTRKKQATNFGTVAHDVVARFYLADDRGLDADGKPVNLYPDGWKIVKDKFAKNDDKADDAFDIVEMTAMEETLLRTLIDKAMTEGVLFRSPGRLVERELGTLYDGEHKGVVLYTDPGTYHYRIILKGFIDLETPTSIEDHKFTREGYAVPVKKLRRNFQLMMYAWEKYSRGHDGNLIIAHNNYIKDFNRPQVIRREDTVDKQYVIDFYNTEILPRVIRLFEYFKKYPSDTPQERAESVCDWEAVPGPWNAEKECNHYFGGPCPFIGICTKQITVPVYQASHDPKLNGTIIERKVPMVTQTTPSGYLDRLKAATAAQNPAPAPAQTPPPAAVAPAATFTPSPAAALANVMANVNKMKQAQAGGLPPAPQAVAPAPVIPAAPPQQKAPWHHEDCKACSDSPWLGFSKGATCRICDALNDQSGRLNSTAYAWDYAKDGVTLVYTVLEGAKPVHPEKAVPQIVAPVQAPAPAHAPAPVQSMVTPPAVQEAPVQAPTTMNMPTPTVSTQISPIVPIGPATPAAPTRKRRTKAQIEADNAAALAAQQAQTPATPAALPPVSFPGVQPTPEDTTQQLDGYGMTPQDWEERKAGTHPTCQCHEESGFILLVGCVLAKNGGTNVVYADDILRMALDDISKSTGKPLHEIEHFALMTALDSILPDLAQSLSVGNSWVTSFAPTKGTALARLVDGLRPYAKKVIAALAV